ncbi:MAG TPA: phytanoyl-CoA dioxygenase family protein [Steroidobacteraceae bacterium]|nr:phytanoyl-CoA dioxygenase family protein [Steroidobacteraceae bacterium]
MARVLSDGVVDNGLVKAFRADGAVCLRGVLNGSELEELRAGIDANLAKPSPRAKVASRPEDPGWFIEDFCNWSENPHYRRFIFESPLAEVAARLTGSARVRLYHDHMLTKEPGTRQRTPWHQDQPYYNIEGRQNVSFWIPVDPVSRASTLEFVGGSHLGPWLMPRAFMSNEAKWFPEGSLADLPDIEAQRPNYRILGWALDPGDVVAFQMLTLHAAAGVEAGRRRRVFSLRLVGDDIRHAPRPWVTSPAFPGLEQELPAGAPLDHPLFPVLWAA